MKKATLTLLFVGILFSVIPIQLAYAGPYEDCLAGKVPYPSSGTEASCAHLKGLSSPSGTPVPFSGKEEAKPTGAPSGSNTTGAPSGSNTSGSNTTGAPSGSNAASKGGQGSLSYSLENPLKFSSLEGFIVAVLNVIIVIATPIVVIFIILAGFKYVTARGNANEVQEATRALTYAIIGGVLIIGAVAIAEIIKGLVTAFS